MGLGRSAPVAAKRQLPMLTTRGALITTIGFGLAVYYTILVIRNPQNSSDII